MRYRTFGRLGWNVAEVGYGMWGVGAGPGGWQGADDETSLAALQLSVDLGCNVFDTAWIYGRGHSEVLLGRLLKDNPRADLKIFSKIPPKDRNWPSARDSDIDDVFPLDHVMEYTEKSLKNLDTARIDLMQFHVWEDAWLRDDRWLATVDALRSSGMVDGIGISINRWEPWNAVAALRTGLVDSVQVIYNIFDQAPEDELFPVCRELDIAVIARVPFDEGTLTGTLTKDTTWPEGDWRASYFVPENLTASVDRAEALKKILPADMTLPELALRFILQNEDVHTVIPGMRSPAHVRTNIAVSDGSRLSGPMIDQLRAHRWDRSPTEWSQ
ncbi:aldo/keto reductase [Actinacidiphila sp. ITFR-21]|uniref:aldo/keto reductase n=1 Tax=Actinacidiphila sp. ITFR-21 TaxID=3075199 RepID=UPI0028891405|nr:aldo/keto reductase [Streptomyces sp. ITFR-21]WNI18015.1 aldo/keto reductase [Streptomyces sp. ITFR-21]